jgi:CRP/FNR family transcriptional regulator, cyclic AMP receptor protein
MTHSLLISESAERPDNCESFCDLTSAPASPFRQLGTAVCKERGTLLFREREHLNTVYVLLAGRVKLSVTSREGRTIILRIAEAGDVLGLSAALAQMPYEATAETLEYCSFKAIDSREFLQFLAHSPEASLQVTKLLATECQRAVGGAQLLGLTHSSSARMARLLLQWAEQQRHDRAEPARLTVALTHEEMGEMAGVARETVTRTLAQFRRRKLIAVKGIAVTILQPQALEQLVA